ncbi:hypothetical protein [Butyrivibrio sp. AE2032]|uniref:hypothetical protein n=1 Tax=Butyrivibrio sp. AE2032 TaxID=1458463 RepID=UPI0005538ABE|nr:hypothetical protein [Butyrivibrio sp. AE2032]
MSINRIDFGVMAASTDVSTIKAAEEAKPYADQQNFQAQFKEEVQNKEHSVNAKNDIDQGKLNSDAQEKGSNEYMGDGGRNRRQNEDKKEALERQLSVEKMEKMAENMLDRKGKPVDLRISSGFDLKI